MGYSVKNVRLTFTLLTDVIRQIQELFKSNPSGEYLVNITPKGKRRSLTANGQQHVWYGQIAKYYGDRSALEVKSMCKDMFGLPILTNSELYGDKIEFLLAKLDYYKHSYESKMKLIQCLSVTSEFNTKESKEYMDNMIFYFNDLNIPIKYED